jgi:hypothetical protein
MGRGVLPTLLPVLDVLPKIPKDTATLHLEGIYNVILKRKVVRSVLVVGTDGLNEHVIRVRHRSRNGLKCRSSVLDRDLLHSALPARFEWVRDLLLLA